MRWRWVSSPRAPQQISRRVSSRALRLELLESRLALSHGPMMGHGPGPERAGPNQPGAAFSHSSFNSGSNDFRMMQDQGFGRGSRQDAFRNDDLWASLGNDQGDGSVYFFEAGPPSGGNSLLAFAPSGDPPELTVVIDIVVTATVEMHVPVAPIAVAVSDLSAALNLLIPNDIQPDTTTHDAQTASSLTAAPVENTKPLVIASNTQVAQPSNGTSRAIDSRVPDGASLPAAPELPPMLRSAPMSGSHGQRAEPLVDATEPIRLLINHSADPRTASETLLASVAINFDAIDRALQAARVEIDKLGHDVVGWLDKSNLSEGVVMVSAALLVGGGYYCWQERRIAKRLGSNAGEASSWLFTQLHNSSH
jgi:hypothetical protein